ncbi:MAG: response regulator [Candidatus Heimdallarchaeota archaeon]|nr:response regulator [Candidatus Heimdallarchaeota archaeon]
MLNSHILIVDDDPDQLNILTLYLKKQNFNVLSAENGPKGIQIFKENIETIGLVITDLHMEDMSGEVFIDEIYKINQNIPILVLTGDPMAISKENVKIKDIIKKPINFFSFKKTVAEYFKE